MVDGRVAGVDRVGCGVVCGGVYLFGGVFGLDGEVGCGSFFWVVGAHGRFGRESVVFVFVFRFFCCCWYISIVHTERLDIE